MSIVFYIVKFNMSLCTERQKGCEARHACAAFAPPVGQNIVTYPVPIFS